MAKVYLSLGSNLGDRQKTIEEAVSYLKKEAGEVLKISKIYETQPVGVGEQPWFLNCAFELETQLPPKELLKICQKIEKKLGRTDKGKLTPRTIDLDILFYDDVVVTTGNLKLPHPAIQNRLFVLRPLFQIAPQLKHPILRKNIAELLKNCKDKSIVNEPGRAAARLIITAPEGRNLS
ncbi:2-amino-4-hydroxy-6-hydroxymethyldihydropteridine diphosphokinase [Candidatus Peregrinibacteria bacterium]|nr:2-amino-4-hydroxy-6-hydroxymethyldihydropteridine diphosphokinase [Candidatus Peregrinibacteria bacterium]